MEVKRPAPKQPLPANAQRVFKGEIFEMYQWEQELFDGTKATFERAKRDDTVNVLPVLPDGQILLIEQEQPTLAPYISAPGGRLDQGEDVLSAAKRELLEETGYSAKEWILVSATQPMAKVDWATYTFVAKGLEKIAEMDLDAGEKVELMPVSRERFEELELEQGFVGPEFARMILEARLDPVKGEALRQLLSP